MGLEEMQLAQSFDTLNKIHVHTSLTTKDLGLSHLVL